MSAPRKPITKATISKDGTAIATIAIGGAPQFHTPDRQLLEKLSQERFVFNPQTHGLKFCATPPTDPEWWTLWLGEATWPKYTITGE